MKKMIVFAILLASCAVKVTSSANRVSAYVGALDPDSTCESSDLLTKVQRNVDGKPLEQLDAALCLSDGILYACHAGYEPTNKKTSCVALMDAHSPDEKKAEAAKAAATAAAKAPPPAPAAPPVDAGAGSGSSK